MPDAFQSPSRKSIKFFKQVADRHLAGFHLFGRGETRTRRATMAAALWASAAIAATSRSAGEVCDFSRARLAKSEIEDSGVCSSFTTPEISRPTAASFSVRESCSCTER